MAISGHLGRRLGLEKATTSPPFFSSKSLDLLPLFSWNEVVNFSGGTDDPRNAKMFSSFSLLSSFVASSRIPDLPQISLQIPSAVF